MTHTPTGSVLFPVLEPLSRATEQTLKAPPLRNTDYLVIDVNDDLTRFLFQARSLDPAPDDASDVEVIDGRRFVPSWKSISHAASSVWIQRVPERYDGHGFGKHQAGATDFTAIVVSHVWPQDRILFASEDARILFDFLLKRFTSQANAARRSAEFKVNGTVPDLPEDFVDHPELPLNPYQRVALANCLNQEAYALFMEQGTGKTPIVINRICYEAMQVKEPGRMYRALVLCPTHLRRNWEVEFERFSTCPGKVGVMRGGLLRRQRTLLDVVRREADCTFGVAVMSLDSLNGTWEAIKRVPWDLVVIDESHYIKNPAAKRSKAARQLNDCRVKQRMILTGTPIANSVFDLWPQFEFLGTGLSGFHTFSNFRSFHGRFKKIARGATPVQKLVGISGIPLLQERLARLAFMIRKSEANLNLPDKVYDIYEVDMTKKQTKVYSDIASKLSAQIEDMIDQPDAKITVDHILTMLLRLAQVTSGHVRLDDSEEPIQVDEVNPKVEAILSMLTDEDRDPKGKTIIWACFREDMRVLSEALTDRGIDHVGYHSCINKEFRKADPAAAEVVFNTDPNCRVFIGNPQSAGEGLNLLGYDRQNPDDSDTYADHEIFMSCNWSVIQRGQAEDRAHRRGTRSNVRITDLVVPGTIDEEIRARVLAKKKTALAIQDVQDILKNVLSYAEED